jgi:acetolactate synthase I/II/III large subunit
MVRQWQDLFYDSRYSGSTEMFNPDFAALARAMGGKGLSLSTEAELGAVMREFLFADPDVPTILNAVCEADEHVFPMVPAGHALHEMVMKRPAPRAAT